jgi:hypothetical protein
MTTLSAYLDISGDSVSKLVARGKALARKYGYSLIKRKRLKGENVPRVQFGK